MKLINILLTNILGNDQDLSLENKFCITCCFYTGFVCFVCIFINIGLQLGVASVINIIISFIIYSSCYILSRFYNKFILSKIIFSIYGIIFSNSYWFTNYGSRGLALGMFLIYFTVIIFIWDNKQIIILSLIVTLNIIGLFILEYSNPGLVPNYNSELTRKIDSYGTIIIYLGIFSILTLTAKNNYIKQYKLAK